VIELQSWSKTFKLIRDVECPYRISFIDSTISEQTKKNLSKFGLLEEQPGKDDSYLIKLKTQKRMSKALKELMSTNPESFEVSQASLEDLFIQLTGKEYNQNR